MQYPAIEALRGHLKLQRKDAAQLILLLGEM
jgi:hypothetical protein